MNNKLSKLIQDTIVFQYRLPHAGKGINKTIFTTTEDACFSSKDSEALVDIIYNGIVEYSYNQHELAEYDFGALHARALENKIRWDLDDKQETKEKYGFYGEVLLHLLLKEYFDTDVLIARGYFYDSTAKREVPGYDSYHIIERDSEVELWFGEVKFHQSYTQAVNQIVNKLESSINDNYLNKNIISFDNHMLNSDNKTSKVFDIIKKWRRKPQISITSELINNNMSLVYPALVIYDDKSEDYDKCIGKVPKYIEEKFQGKKFNLSVNYKLFFIFIPVSKVKAIKEDVIECITSKKPLIL